MPSGENSKAQMALEIRLCGFVQWERLGDEEEMETLEPAKEALEGIALADFDMIAKCASTIRNCCWTKVGWLFNRMTIADRAMNFVR